MKNILITLVLASFLSACSDNRYNNASTMLTP